MSTDALAAALYRRSQQFQRQRGSASEPEHACQRYVEPHGAPLTRPDCTALLAHLPSSEHQNSLAGTSNDDCCWVFKLPFRKKRQQLNNGGNAPLTWRRPRAATSRTGGVPARCRAARQQVHDVMVFLMHHLCQPVQSGADVLERCHRNDKCARPSHAVVGRVHNLTPKGYLGEVSASSGFPLSPHRVAAASASSASTHSPPPAPTPVPPTRSDRGASPDHDARVAAPQSGTATASFGAELGAELECDEELTEEDAASSSAAAPTRKRGHALRYTSFSRCRAKGAAAAADAASLGRDGGAVAAAAAGTTPATTVGSSASAAASSASTRPQRQRKPAARYVAEAAGASTKRKWASSASSAPRLRTRKRQKLKKKKLAASTEPSDKSYGVSGTVITTGWRRQPLHTYQGGIGAVGGTELSPSKVNAARLARLCC